MTLVCWSCGNDLSDVPLPISRQAQCSQCFQDLHACRLCQHYDASATTTCFEDRADVPVQKENANFCEYFQPQAGRFEAKRGASADDAKAQLDALFGAEAAAQDGDAPKPSQPSTPEDEARRKLDDLFS